jgi:hypothetical protein
MARCANSRASLLTSGRPLGNNRKVLVTPQKGAIARCSWTPEESQVESSEHQDNANIHCQPFPESVSEEHEIYTDYDGCHRHHVKHESYLSAHDTVLLHSRTSVINIPINAEPDRPSTARRDIKGAPFGVGLGACLNPTERNALDG